MPPARDQRFRVAPYAFVPDRSIALSRFYLADCLDVFKALPAAHVSVIVTSPPYNLGVRYRSYDDSLPRREYLLWTEAWIAAAAQGTRTLRAPFF